MVAHTRVYFNVENISNKDINLFGSYRLGAGNSVDLFKAIPSLSESRLIDALRAPLGELYIFAVLQKKIAIHDFKLASFDNVFIDAEHISSKNAPERGTVLSYDGSGLFWSRSSGGGYFEADAPLVRDGDTLRLDRAGPHTSGYLSKEDWLAFSNITTGFRVWQYCDLPSDPGVKCKITSFSSVDIPFSESSIVNGSAVIVNSDTLLAPGRNFWNKVSGKKPVSVIQHIGNDVVLSSAPDKSEPCRLYFLVCLPPGMDIPEKYNGAPAYVRKVRADYFDFIDLNSSRTEIIKGKKTFKSDVTFESNQSISGKLSVGEVISAHSIILKDSPQANYTLTSSAMGSGSWQPNPLVSSGPPLNCYDGQLWVSSNNFELFVYDGVRGCWVGVAERPVSAWSPQLLSHGYLGVSGGSTSDILPYRAVLVGLVASSGKGVPWTAEVHVNGVAIAGAAVGVGEDGRGYRMNLNVEFSAGDQLQFFVNGHMVDKPKIEAIFRKIP